MQLCKNKKLLVFLKNKYKNGPILWKNLHQKNVLFISYKPHLTLHLSKMQGVLMK